MPEMTYRHIIHMVSNYRNIVKVTGSNNFAITSAELGEGLQESASAIVAAGGSIDEAIALTTAGE